MNIFKGKRANPDLFCVWVKARENANDSGANECHAFKDDFSLTCKGTDKMSSGRMLKLTPLPSRDTGILYC